MSRFEKCGVCEDDTHPISFYGAIVCNPCRAFFRRQVLQTRVRQSDNLLILLTVEGIEPLKCKLWQQCLISGPLRKKCSWCRFQKCLAIGMKPDSVKTRTHIMNEMKHLEISSSRSDGISNHETAFLFNSSSSNSPEEEQQYSMCYDTSLVPLQQLYWNEDTAHFTPYLWKQDLPLSWQQLASFGPPQNSRSLWLKKPAGSSIEYTLIDVMMTPGTNYFMTVDVQNEALTSFDFSDTAQSSLDLPATALIMTSIQGCNVFHKQSDSSVFDVQVICQNQGNSPAKQIVKQIVMKSLTKRHWKRLQEMTKAYKFWEFFMTIHVPDVNPTDSSRKRLFLSAATDICSKNITLGIYSLEIIQGICLEDQVIVAKEAYFALGVLLYIHTYVRHENACVIYSPETRNVLQMCIHIDSNRAHFSTELYDMYRSFLEDCYDFLRVDSVVIALLSLLVVYNDIPGLSCSKLFEQERNVHIELLDMYIDAKVESKEWNLSKKEIWDHIARFVTLLGMAKPVRVKFAREQYQAKEKPHDVQTQFFA